MRRPDTLRCNLCRPLSLLSRMNRLLLASFVVAVGIVVVPVLLSWYFRGWVAKYDSPVYTFDHIPDQTGKVAIVTGSNTGIGKVTVRELARKGARVILTSRSIAKGEQAKKDICAAIAPSPCNVDVKQLDLSSLANVEAFANDFKASSPGGVPQLDILVLNAGVMMCPYTETEDGVEMQFGTNHLGHFHLVQELLPALEESHARVVTVSSNAHEMGYSEGIRFNQLTSSEGYSNGGAYGQSKLANILFSNELSHRAQTAGTGLTANAVHPGFIHTDLGRHLEEDISGTGAYLAPVLGLAHKWIFSAAMETDSGALTQLYVATAPELKGVTGKYFQPIAKLATPLSLTNDRALQQKLWAVSEDLVNASKQRRNA